MSSKTSVVVQAVEKAWKEFYIKLLCIFVVAHWKKCRKTSHVIQVDTKKLKKIYKKGFFDFSFIDSYAKCSL